MEGTQRLSLIFFSVWNKEKRNITVLIKAPFWSCSPKAEKFPLLFQSFPVFERKVQINAQQDFLVITLYT